MNFGCNIRRQLKFFKLRIDFLVELFGPLFDTVDLRDLRRDDVIALQSQGRRNVPEILNRAELLEAKESVAEDDDMIIGKS